MCLGGSKVLVGVRLRAAFAITCAVYPPRAGVPQILPVATWCSSAAVKRPSPASVLATAVMLTSEIRRCP